jgi:hypothetical protein
MTNLRKKHNRLTLAACIAASLFAGEVFAQEAQTIQPPPTQDGELGEGETPYVDRVIDASTLPALPPDEEELLANTEGLPRSIRVEGIVSQNKRGNETFNEQGVSVGAFWDTKDWGQFSVDATVFRSNRDRRNPESTDYNLGGTATLWQRNFHLNDHLTMNNGLGVLNTPAVPLQRNQYRFFLPTVPYAGISSEVIRSENGLLLQAGFGRNGTYDGTRVIGFELTDGTVAALGAQWKFSPSWTGAASYLETNGRLRANNLGEFDFQEGNTQALYGTAEWRNKDNRVQINVQASDGDFGKAAGAWVDAEQKRGRYTHNYGGFYLQPDLAWGAFPINNDAAGAYYRLGYQYGRMNWNIGADQIQSISGEGFDGTYATSYLRYQSSSTFGYGGALNARIADGGNAYSTQLFADKRTRFGQTRLQLDQADTGGDSDSWQVSVDQSFPVKTGSRIAASVSYGEISYLNQAATRTTSVALYGGKDITERLTIDGNARWTHGSGSEALRGTDLNIGLNWRLSNRFSLAATFYKNKGSQRSPFVLDPLADPGGFISLPRDQSVFLSLRYDRQAGRAVGNIGGSPVGASGSITGSVFLDENRDGIRNASELPAANLTVIIDGRFAVRTDSMGRFAFDQVSVGARTISVVPDNLPLPWSIDEGQATQVIQVHTRQTQTIEIGATRPL